MTISENLQKIRASIPSYVRLIAVTKQVSVAVMLEAYQAGIRDFGENRLQEALTKQEQLKDLKDICWHFIGHLQTNKAKKALQHFHWIHSVDSLKLAQYLNQYTEDLPTSPQICLQVKMLPDANKYGWQVDELWADLPELVKCKNLNIQGLMTILPLGLTDAEKLATFEQIKPLATQINSQFPLNLVQLSMGMSGDYPLAIQAGATMIRLGRILFGEHN